MGVSLSGVVLVALFFNKTIKYALCECICPYFMLTMNISKDLKLMNIIIHDSSLSP